MDAVTPTTIKLDDLTRDELLELIARTNPFVRPRDLLRARWEVAVRKSQAANNRLTEACACRVAAAAKHAAVPVGSRKRHGTWTEYLRAGEQYDAAYRASERAYAAQERAYRALDACKP